MLPTPRLRPLDNPIAYRRLREKHWFLVPATNDSRYTSGGLQIFRRAFDLVANAGAAELVTYRHREHGIRFLDDVAADDLTNGFVWITWQAHVAELAERLPAGVRAVLFSQALDFGKRHGQLTPPRWPIVCLSRFIAADYAVKERWRLVLHLPPALHPRAVNRRSRRDIDVLVHHRKMVPYVVHRLVPALKNVGLRVQVMKDFVAQEDFFVLLNRSKVHLYWTHKLIPGLELFEGLGMQPLEAIACGAIPVVNLYGGVSDYLEPPYNCRKIGVHSLQYDVAQIQRAVDEHDGHNPDEDRIRYSYGEAMFLARFQAIERELIPYFATCPIGRPEEFEVAPPKRKPLERMHVALHREFWQRYRAIRGIRPE
jgi:hypothetical protein